MDAHQFQPHHHTNEREHTMKATGIIDILAILPSMLGAEPDECITMPVVKDGRLYGAMAGPMPNGGDEATALLEKFVEQAEVFGVETAFITIHTTNVGDKEEAAYAIFAAAFAVGCMSKGIKVGGMVLVTDQFWVDYDAPEVKRDLAELQASNLAAELVAAGINLSPDAPKHVPNPDRASMSLTLKALEFRATLPAMNFRALTDRDRTLMLTAWERWTSVISTDGDMSEREAADLIGYFQHSLFRDMFATYFTADDVDLDGLATVLTKLIMSGDPAWLPRAKRILTTLRELLRWTEPAQRPNMLALAGFAEWLMGHGTAAAAYFAEGKAIDPDHTLISLLDQVAQRTGLSKSITHPDAAQYASIINA